MSLMERNSIFVGMWKHHPQKWILAYFVLFIVLYFLLCHGSNLGFCGSEAGSNHFSDIDQDDDMDTAILMKVPIHEVMSGQPVQVQLEQDDRRIISYIWRKKLLEPPSSDGYKIQKPGKNPSMGQGQLIQSIFANMTNGFFVEAGALDGETRSNSLFLEMHLGWKGLLVEADPANYALVKHKHRKAWTSNTCLAIKLYPHQTEFVQNFNMGKIISSSKSPTWNKKMVTVQCIPLFSLLSALNVTTVDYFSLDVEGSELQVLKTIPFDKLLIKTLSVEFIHTTEGKDSLREFMETKGYKMIQEIRDPDGLANDFIFVHSTVIDYLRQ